MKIGTHSLGSNAFANTTLVKGASGMLAIRQVRSGVEEKIILSAEQAKLLKEVLA